MTTAEPPVQEFHTPRDVRRGVVAGVGGNMLEWYDLDAGLTDLLSTIACPRIFQVRCRRALR